MLMTDLEAPLIRASSKKQSQQKQGPAYCIPMAIHQGADQHVTASRHTNPHKVGKKKKKASSTSVRHFGAVLLAFYSAWALGFGFQGARPTSRGPGASRSPTTSMIAPRASP